MKKLLRHPSSSFAAAGLAAAALTLSLGGCTPKTDDTKITWSESTSEAVDLMTKARGTFGINGTPTAVWLDPRSEMLYEAGHIPGALNLPFPRLEAEHTAALKGVDVIVVYGTDYEDTLVKAVAKRLISLNYEEVYILRGGLKAWTRDGNTVEAGPAKPKETESDGAESENGTR
ncbi:MAG: rhodanese-like domain-containing protein [Phycisphaerae bacterium]|nr:rhodanese-like domain-containing protein [Phycisphaerae bacterium]